MVRDKKKRKRAEAQAALSDEDTPPPQKKSLEARIVELEYKMSQFVGDGTTALQSYITQTSEENLRLKEELACLKGEKKEQNKAFRVERKPASHCFVCGKEGHKAFACKDKR